MSRLVFLILTMLISVILMLPLAHSKSAIITMIKGDTEIFVNPSSEPVGTGPHVKFNNSYYTIKRAKIGRKVKYKQVVKTGVNSQVKLTYPNGDTFMVGPATAYSLVSKNNKGNKRSSKVMNLLYGKVRAVVSKKGPLNKLKVITKSSVAGVRGTDFFVSYFPGKEDTSLSVIRGQVNVKPINSKKAETVVKSGNTIEIKSVPTESSVKKEKTVQLKPVTKSKLVEIQKSSSIVLSKTKELEVQEELKKLDVATQTEIKKVNEKSVEIVLDDIKSEDKTQYDLIMQSSKKKKITTIEAINTKIVGQLFEKAPEEKLEKLREGDLKSSEDFYKKYNKDY